MALYRGLIREIKGEIVKFLIILIAAFLTGCIEDRDARDCAEQIIVDYNYVTHDDGSVTVGAPIYECIRYFDK